MGLLRGHRSNVNRRANPTVVSKLFRSDIRNHRPTTVGDRHVGDVSREAEDKYQVLFENLNDAAFLADVETGTILETNKQAERLLCRPRDEIVGMHQTELHPPGQGEKYRRKFGRHVANEHAADYDGEIVTKDGTVVPVFISASTMTIGGRGVILGLFRDISDQKRVEEKLRYRAEFERLVSGISTKFINIDLAEVDCAIGTALEDIGRFAGASRSYLFLFSENGGEARKTHEWCDEGGAQDSGPKDIESSVVVPVGPGDHPIGFLGLDSAKEARGWSEDTIPLLRILGEVFANALARAQAEEALRESEQKLDAMLSSIPDHMSMMDGDLTIMWANETAKRLFGDDLVGRKCYEVYHRRKQPCEPAPCLTLKAFQDGKTHEHDTQVVDKDGQVRYFHCTASVALRDETGRPTAVMEVSRDITDQRRAEEALKEAHRQTEQLLGAIPSILIGADTTGTITRWNEAAERTFGIAAQDAVGRHFARCSIQWDWVNVLGRVEQWLADGGPRQLRLDDVRFTRTNGKDGLLGITVNPVVNDTGEFDGFLLFAADVTKRRELESQLIQAQKLESIGQLAAGIAHEINTPTQYVGDNIRFLKDSFGDLLELLGKGGRFLEAARRGSVTPELVAEMEAAARDADVEYLAKEIPKAIEQSLEGVDRVATIVRAMKEFSHPGGKEKSAVDVNRAIGNTVTVARNEWKYVAEMDTDFDESLPPVPCLPGEFNQMILNIIINAAHAIADVVGDGSNGKGQITIVTRRDDGWAEIRISDTGSGVPEAVRDRLFDPFFTTKEVGKGTGQGLSIARSVIVDKHGGTITFESETGKGTTFIIRLPLENSPSGGHRGKDI